MRVLKLFLQSLRLLSCGTSVKQHATEAAAKPPADGMAITNHVDKTLTHAMRQRRLLQTPTPATAFWHWQIANVGDSCDEFCASRGGCQAPAFALVTSEAYFTNVVYTDCDPKFIRAASAPTDGIPLVVVPRFCI
eukprot:gene10422-biopygen4050